MILCDELFILLFFTINMFFVIHVMFFFTDKDRARSRFICSLCDDPRAVVVNKSV